MEILGLKAKLINEWFLNCFLYRFDILLDSKLLFTHDNNKN